MKASKVQYAKNRTRLTSGKRKLLAVMEDIKEVATCMLPDAPESKKGKGKRSDSLNCIPCPLLPGVPAVPSQRRVLRSQKTTGGVMLVGKSADTFVSNPVMETTVEDSDSDVIESTPPKMAKYRPLLNKRKRKLHLPPLLGDIQVTDQPVNPVWADIEVIESTPQSSTSRTAPGSGSSTISYEIDDDIEHELIELDDSGSEIEMDNNIVDRSLGSRIIFENSAEFNDLIDPTLAEDIQSIGAEDDVAIRTMADPDDGDLLCFDWRSDFNNFQGVREIFTGPSGPTFEVKGLTPVEVFKKIWDDDIIDHIVRETNRYAHQMQAASTINSRVSRWRDTTGDEIWRFFTIIMLQSLVVNNVEREYWYPSNLQLKIGAFEDIMSYNRFTLLKKCIHFVDNTSLPKNSNKIDKLVPIIEHLNKKFSTIYLPEQNVMIDESLLLWRGRLSFAQVVAKKKERIGIKSYELCESRSGYLWKMQVFSGEDHNHAPQEVPQQAVEVQRGNKSESATSQIVHNLMRPLFGKGHTLITDSFYNAPLLSRLLKTKHKTDTMGTLRRDREFVPSALICKDKNNMKAGEVCFSTTKDLSVFVWNDKNVVSMISTYHPPEVGGKEKYGYCKYKPKVFLDYNLSMASIDHKDQMLDAFPVERIRNVTWYKKLFRRLVNLSIYNAMVIYNHDRAQKTQLGNREFRHQLVRGMLQMYCPLALKEKEPPPSAPMSQMHLPAKNRLMQRCKLCKETKVRRSTKYRCSTCQVSLCIEGCYTEYHAKYVCQ